MAVKFIPFDPWAPDRSEFNTQSTEQALNVIRTTNGYRPFPSLEYFSSSDTMPAGRAVGMFWARDDNSGLAVQWVVLDDSSGNGGVYELVSSDPDATAWADATLYTLGDVVTNLGDTWECIQGHLSDTTPISGNEPGSPGNNSDQYWELWDNLDSQQSWTLRQAAPGGNAVTSTNRWRPAQFQNKIYVANYENNLMSKLIASGTGAPNFDALEFYGPGENPGDTPTGGTVKARYVAAVRDFLVIGYCDDPTFTDPGGRTGGFHPDRVRWSAIGNADYFSLEGSADLLSDFQDLPDAGEVRGIIGGEYGIIICENGLFRMDFVGPPNIFSFNRIERARGCLEPNSVVAANNIVYYLAADGWRSFDGQTIKPIGAEKFDRWFFSQADPNTLETMSRAVDPNNQLIIWAFNTDANNNDINDCMLIYNYSLQEASYAKIDTTLVGTFISPGFTLEGLDIVSGGLGAIPVWSGATVSYNTGDLVYTTVDTPIAEPDGWVVWEALQDHDSSANTEPGGGGATDLWKDFWKGSSNHGIDALPSSLDSTAYVSQEQSFGGIAASAPGAATTQLRTFTGKNLEAVVDTSEQRLGGDRRVRVSKIQTAIEGNAQTIEMQIFGRNRLGVPVVFGPRKQITSDGEYVFNGDARYQRARANISGEWEDATGVFMWYEVTSDR